MRTEFPIEWEGFTAAERRRLETRWARISFPHEFAARFQGTISKGSPGEDSVFHFEAKDLNFIKEHFSGGLRISSLDEVIQLTADLATKFYDGLVRQGVLPAD